MSLFIWGRKAVVRSLGRVADFCPICREAGVFELLETRVVAHIYYIPLGRGTPAGGNQIRCLRCGTQMWVKAEEYAQVSQDRTANASALFATLGPAAAAAVQERLRLEVRVQACGLSPEERTVLVEEPFLLLSSRLDARAESTRIDRRSGLALAATIGLPILLMTIEAHAPRSLETAFGVLEIAVIVIGLAATLYLVATDRRRHYQEVVEPLLTRSLAPLRPSREELARALKKLKQIGKTIADRADIERLLKPPQTKDPARAKA